jgi:DNA (cytosine-5)-methyltransferase 3A
MKVLSLFDGISCGMLALERAGIIVDRYVAYEIDKYAIQVSKKNYPKIEQKGDVTVADFSEYKGFDLLIGGSPCQSLSIIQSKTRQHLDGKSKLFFDYVMAKQVVKPKHFLFENVASMNNESKKTISEWLGCEPIFIDSADFSAQSRPRLYWTNIPVKEIDVKSKLVLDDILQKEVNEKYYYTCSFDYLGEDKTVVAKLSPCCT